MAGSETRFSHVHPVDEYPSSKLINPIHRARKQQKKHAPQRSHQYIELVYTRDLDIPLPDHLKEFDTEYFRIYDPIYRKGTGTLILFVGIWIGLLFTVATAEFFNALLTALSWVFIVIGGLHWYCTEERYSKTSAKKLTTQRERKLSIALPKQAVPE